MKTDKPSWDKLLNSEASLKLKEIGRLISEARKQRKMSVVDLADRVGVDRRTIGELEKGSPKVSLGIFFQVLSALNLLRGIEELVNPENDIEAINSSVRRIRNRQTPKKKIDDTKVNF
jgi:transcriptional regulator with XRE-family HTH domain